ncbi:hypothetical protein CHU98_g6961 [Xylaria longipes]|nr:hypothetical protein CHU98_g6961 [Xylaria longipes]
MGSTAALEFVDSDSVRELQLRALGISQCNGLYASTAIQTNAIFQGVADERDKTSAWSNPPSYTISCSLDEHQIASQPRTHNDYTVGWVCALPKEQTAATAVLDGQIHPELPKLPNDYNTYTLGSIGSHNIIIACLPKGKIGTNSAVRKT